MMMAEEFRGLIVLAIVNLSIAIIIIPSITLANVSTQENTLPMKNYQQKTIKSSSSIKDPITDLKRLSSLKNEPVQAGVTTKLSDTILDEGASANFGSIFSNIIDNGNDHLDVHLKQEDQMHNSASNVPLYESSQSFIDSLLHGKRRFDGDNDALASTGQVRKNNNNFRNKNNFQLRQLQQQHDLDLFLKQAASKGYNRMSPNYHQNGYSSMTMTGGKNDRSFYMNNNNNFNNNKVNANRRSMMTFNGNGNDRQQVSGGKFDNRMNNNQHYRQESRKRASRPTLNNSGNNRNKKGRENSNDDDIFNDNDDNRVDADDGGSSDRRADDDDDGEEDDRDDDDSGDGSRTSADGSDRGRKNKNRKGRKMKAASEHPSNNIDNNIDNDAEGEDSDSTNNLKQKVLLVQPVKNRRELSNGNLRNNEDYSNTALEKKTSYNNNIDIGSNDESNNNISRRQEEDSDPSASHVKNSSTDLQAAAGHHHGHHDHYYQHVEVPKKKAWKFGFKRGNHKHTIERHEKGHKHKFHSAFKWHAKEKCKKKKKCKSVGKMTWEYKHAKKHHH